VHLVGPYYANISRYTVQRMSNGVTNKLHISVQNGHHQALCKIIVCPIINGLSVHDAQSVTLNTISLKASTKQIMEIRKFDKNFNKRLSN